MNKSLKKKIVEWGIYQRISPLLWMETVEGPKENNLPRVAGHSEGINSVREIVRVCGEIGYPT
ncbi:MAG: hypothetical protein Ct9H300mP29_4420 [Candidatus Neomarinimicrobiota bacterium]|nr:MAG: hypothetical protein Ct9H300mP29_4420 [Candidatus Neomarinimicrobiota bacterium]